MLCQADRQLSEKFKNSIKCQKMAVSGIESVELPDFRQKDWQEKNKNKRKMKKRDVGCDMPFRVTFSAMHLLLNYLSEEKPIPKVEFQTNKQLSSDTFHLFSVFLRNGLYNTSSSETLTMTLLRTPTRSLFQKRVYFKNISLSCHFLNIKQFISLSIGPLTIKLKACSHIYHANHP